ncbi:MAG: RNA polymerase sigma factor [Gammaproteobacteria bacterium]|jgi:RNA polymerase sigma factor (sigma-70 family)
MPRLLSFPRKTRRFEALLVPHLEHLYRLAYRWCGNREDAEDLVQELVIKLYPRLDELERLERARTWLARVLYNLYVDEVRRRQRSPLVQAVAESEAVLSELSCDRPEPGLLAEGDELQMRLLQALRGINPDQRVVVTLHDVEGYTLEEIEQIIDTPLGTLKSRLHRARRALRDALDREPFPTPRRVNEQR